MLDGVGYAHAAGVVHRDLKPENVFMTNHPGREQRSITLLDFGLAKLHLTDDDESWQPHNTWKRHGHARLHVSGTAAWYAG